MLFRSDQRQAVAEGDKSMRLLVNGEPLEIQMTKKDMVFVDIFSYISFDLSKPQGILVLKLNHERAKYTDVLCDGDVVEIYWNP